MQPPRCPSPSPPEQYGWSSTSDSNAAAPKPARPPLVATPFAHHGIKPLIVRDKMPVETACEQPQASYPNVASSRHASSSQSLSLKTDSPKQHITVSVVTENKSRVASPGTQTAPTLSRSPPVHPTQAQSVCSSLREEPKQHVNDVMKEKMRAGSPASRESILRRLECSHEHPQPSQFTCVLSNEYPPLFEAKAIPHGQCHPCSVVSRTDRMSDECSHVVCETVSQQSHPHNTKERSLECSEIPSEPTALPWIQPFDPAHPPDMLQQSEAVSKCPDTGCQSSPQAGFKEAVKQPPESWLIDTVAALTRACLARRAASEEFCPRLPRHPSSWRLVGRSAPEELRP
jgi:hypothetical protein